MDNLILNYMRNAITWEHLKVNETVLKVNDKMNLLNILDSQSMNNTISNSELKQTLNNNSFSNIINYLNIRNINLDNIGVIENIQDTFNSNIALHKYNINENVKTNTTNYNELIYNTMLYTNYNKNIDNIKKRNIQKINSINLIEVDTNTKTKTKEDNNINSELIIKNIKIENNNKEDEVINIDNINCIYNIIVNSTKTNLTINLNNNTITNNLSHIKINLILKENSNSNIVIISNKRNNIFNLVSLNVFGGLNSNSNITQVFMGNKKEVIKLSYLLDQKSNVNTNSLYLLQEDEYLDMYYDINHIGKESVSNLNVEGVMKDKSVKLWKGVITFHKGCTGSDGKENERVILLSDECISKTLPILLCRELDVKGNHGSTSGNIDESKIFYLNARGINKQDAQNIIIMSRFEPILEQISNQILRDNIRDSIKNSITNINK